MLSGVAHVRTNVSEERSPSIIRVTRIGELKTTLAITRHWRTLRRSIITSSLTYLAYLDWHETFRCWHKQRPHECNKPLYATPLLCGKLYHIHTAGTSRNRFVIPSVMLLLLAALMTHGPGSNKTTVGGSGHSLSHFNYPHNVPGSFPRRECDWALSVPISIELHVHRVLFHFSP
jgi:hypothetical protein